MKRQIVSLVIVVCLLLAAIPVCGAADYTYTLTFSAGRQGTFSGSMVSVAGSDATVTESGSKVIVSGLHLNDVVTFRLGGVQVTADDRYYVRGLRESGKDNSTVGVTAITVKGDQDFVVAYGIKGNMTQYTVNFEDRNGNKLADSHTYYGNVGDKPVVAYLYIADYVPEAYNLTKTLSANLEENVFTFVYTRLPQPGPAPTTRPENPTEPTEPEQPGGENPTEPEQPGGETPTEPTEPGGEEPTSPNLPSEPENPDVPTPSETIDLDDEPGPGAPGASGDEPGAQEGSNWLVWTAVGGGGLIAALALLFLFLRKRKKA